MGCTIKHDLKNLVLNFRFAKYMEHMINESYAVTLSLPGKRGVPFPFPFYGNEYSLAVVVHIYISLISFSMEKRQVYKSEFHQKNK